MKPYYEDSLVTLYHGDCREWTGSADVIVTDPPYGIAWFGNGYRHPSLSPITGDEDVSLRDEFLARFPDTPALVFGSLKAPFPPGTRHVLAWRKGDFGTGLVGNRLPWLRDWDPIFVVGPWPDQTPSRSGHFATTERAASGYSGYITRYGHPHAKPVDTLIALLDACPDGTVLDPFAGTGSTLVAAKSLGRRAIGIEIEERYCEVAARRCSQEVLGLVG